MKFSITKSQSCNSEFWGEKTETRKYSLIKVPNSDMSFPGSATKNDFHY